MRATKDLNRTKTNNGITLIALVITIIVMLILVAVTIAMAVDGGLFGKATIAGIQTNEAVLAEKDLGNGKFKIKEGSKIYEYETIDDYFTNTPSKVYEDGEIEEEIPGGGTNTSHYCEKCNGDASSIEISCKYCQWSGDLSDLRGGNSVFTVFCECNASYDTSVGGIISTVCPSCGNDSVDEDVELNLVCPSCKEWSSKSSLCYVSCIVSASW